MEGSPNVLAFGLRGHPGQSGLGSFSVLPAEIRSQIWNIALPQTDRFIELAPLAKRNWTVLARWPEKRRNRNTLAFARASKRLYDEVMAQFFHKRSLAVVFAVNYPKAPWNRDSGRSCTGIHAILVNVGRSSAMNFANFASIELLIELPFFNSWFQLDSLIESIQDFSLCVQRWQDRQERLGLHSSCPSIDIVLYTRPMSEIVEAGEATTDDDDDSGDDDSSDFGNAQNAYAQNGNAQNDVSRQSYTGLDNQEDTTVEYCETRDSDDDDLFQDTTDHRAAPNNLEVDVEDTKPLFPSLKTIALLLQPLRDIQRSRNVTIEADFELRFGQEWLAELFGQVTDDMQKSGKTRPEHWRWRQINMEIALDQSDRMTRNMAEWAIWAPGGTLPVGPPEEPPDDVIE